MVNRDYIILENKNNGELSMAKISPYAGDKFIVFADMIIKRIEGPHHYVITRVRCRNNSHGSIIRYYSDFEIYDLEYEFADAYYNILQDVHKFQQAGRVIHLELDENRNPRMYLGTEF